MSLLETTLNTRDLGGHKTKDGKTTIFNRIYRSDQGKNPPNEKDINFLLSNGITTIIDIRSIENISSNKNYFSQIEDFEYVNYPIKEGSQIPKSTEDVPKSYLEIACSKNIIKILEKIANTDGGVMFHCSAGKDRTGVLAAIIFMICNVLEEEIIKDYIISKECLKDKFIEIQNNYPDIDINIVIPQEEYIINFMKLFYEKFDNINNYLDWIGLSRNDSNMLRDKLLK